MTYCTDYCTFFLGCFLALKTERKERSPRVPRIRFSIHGKIKTLIEFSLTCVLSVLSKMITSLKITFRFISLSFPSHISFFPFLISSPSLSLFYPHISTPHPTPPQALFAGYDPGNKIIWLVVVHAFYFSLQTILLYLPKQSTFCIILFIFILLFPLILFLGDWLSF